MIAKPKKKKRCSEESLDKTKGSGIHKCCRSHLGRRSGQPGAPTVGDVGFRLHWGAGALVAGCATVEAMGYNSHWEQQEEQQKEQQGKRSNNRNKRRGGAGVGEHPKSPNQEGGGKEICV